MKIKIRFLLLFVVALSFIHSPVVLRAQETNDFEISKNLDVFSELFKQLEINYVDQIKPGDLMQKAIDAMLNDLDPYTNYIPESKIEEYELMTTGQYGGIGALIHKQGDYVVISEPYENFPAFKADLRAGDKILEVDKKSAKGKESDDVSTILKGQPGTTLELLIQREGEQTPMKKSIVREKIKIENIPYFGMLNETVGYIKLSAFTQNAGREVKDAMTELKDKHGMKALILDLRGNGGGLLNEAVNIVNLFVDKDELVVSTKGKLRNKNNNYKTMAAPIDKEMPVAILIDESSASASEIVAGAMQDLDRGVIIGQVSYGKGLVQNVFPLSYNAKVKITVAKYYIPSGRCIQAIDYAHKDTLGHAGNIPDSLITPYKTKNGRTVFDGKGIAPDIEVTSPFLSNISVTLITRYLIFDYANKFRREHDSISKPEVFAVTDEIFDDFVSYIKTKDYSYTTRSEQALKQLVEIAKTESYYKSMQQELEQLHNKMAESKNDDLERNKEEIEDMLRIEIVSRYYFQKGKVISSLSDDPDVSKAIEVLSDQPVYTSILSGPKKASTEAGSNPN